MSEAGNWCLIESDPGVFTELVQKFGTEHCLSVYLSVCLFTHLSVCLFIRPSVSYPFVGQKNSHNFFFLYFLVCFLSIYLFTYLGVSGVQVEELWSLDKEQFQDLHPVFGSVPSYLSIYQSIYLSIYPSNYTLYKVENASVLPKKKVLCKLPLRR